MTLPPGRIGDKGQRYEVRYLDHEDNEQVAGWHDDPTGGNLIKMIELHPSWHSPRVIDRRRDDRQPND